MDPLTSLSTQGENLEVTTHSVSTVQHPGAPHEPFARRYTQLLEEFVDLALLACSTAVLEGSSAEHAIHTTSLPVFEHPRRLTGERLAAAKTEYAVLFDQGIIRPSSSQWASTLHLVQKRSGDWCTTDDYRRLNAATVPDRYPLPIIEDLLQDYYGYIVFSSIEKLLAQSLSLPGTSVLQKAFY